MSEYTDHGWTQTPQDRALAGALAERLPSRVFDAHAHFYRAADMVPMPPFFAAGPPVCGAAQWRAGLGELVGGPERMAGGLILASPGRGADVHAVNRWVIDATRTIDVRSDARDRRDGLRATVLVDPNLPASSYAPFLDEPHVVGFKVYHTYARRAVTMEARIGEFLPEWVWNEADGRGWVIMLHLVRSRSLADPANQEEIRRNCLRYPNARLILAHGARGFHGPDTVAGIGALRGLTNVWFDSSAICEAEPLAAILHELGPRRLMYGSDFPVTHQRGRALTLGDGFFWLTTDALPWPASPNGRPVQVGLERLRALLQAADQIDLNDADKQDLFCGNAERLLGIATEDPDIGSRLYERAKRVIPGATGLFFKRAENHLPGLWPSYFREARGCEIIDEAGRRFLDVGPHGVGACALGYRDPDVTAAVQRRVGLGSYCLLNSREEIELAELLCELHPWAEQVRFARSGGETMAVAVRIARATTGRSLLAVCGYHGWHDWYLAANLGDEDALDGHLLPGLDPAGVPAELRGTTLTFPYGDRDAFSRIIAEHGDRLAAVVMEPLRSSYPEPGYLEMVRDECRRAGALLVFDEITIGWRLAPGGSHLRLGVTPDIAAFAKALGNGHPMGAVVGSAAAMDGAHTSFISSTYWTEGVGVAAAMATLRKMQRIDLPAHCRKIGRRVLAGWTQAAERHGVPLRQTSEVVEIPRAAFDGEQALALRTLYVQRMLERGFLAGLTMFPCYAHDDAVIDDYVQAMDPVMAELADALSVGDIETRLAGGVVQPGFRRLN